MVTVSWRMSPAGWGEPARTLSKIGRSKKRLPGLSRFYGVDSKNCANLSLATKAATADLDLNPKIDMMVE